MKPGFDASPPRRDLDFLAIKRNLEIDFPEYFLPIENIREIDFLDFLAIKENREIDRSPSRAAAGTIYLFMQKNG